MEPKKISFGFSKTKKKAPSLIPSKPEPEKNVEYITSFDGKSKIEEKQELIIPVKTNYSVAERITSKRKKEAEAKTETEDPVNPDDKSVSLEKLAIQELLSDATKIPENDISTFTIPLEEDFEQKIDTATDPDYDSVPVGDFGYAMLRGMGWAPGKGIGKKQKVVEVRVPEVRARGLGLGADAPVSKDE